MEIWNIRTNDKGIRIKYTENDEDKMIASTEAPRKEFADVWKDLADALLNGRYIGITMPDQSKVVRYYLESVNFTISTKYGIMATYSLYLFVAGAHPINVRTDKFMLSLMDPEDKVKKLTLKYMEEAERYAAGQRKEDGEKKDGEKPMEEGE